MKKGWRTKPIMIINDSPKPMATVVNLTYKLCLLYTRYHVLYVWIWDAFLYVKLNCL